VTDQLHPEVADRAVEAARVVGLAIAGIDVVAAEVSRPLEEQGGAVVAVVPRPDLALHLRPAVGAARPVADAVVAHLFPDDRTGRIPVVAVTGVNGKTTTTRLTAHLLARAGYRVGMTCTEGIFVGPRRVASGDCSGPASAGWVLQNPHVEAAVLETARGGILRAGLGFDRCDVAVVTNIGEGDHLGTAGVDTLEQLAYAKSTLVAAVAPGGTAVLRADDPLVADMARWCRGNVLYFGPDGAHERIVRHRAAGGRAAFVQHGRIVLAEGDRETWLVTLDRVPLTHGGRIGFHVLNALAAAAAAWGLGVPLETVRAGLESFVGCLDMVPGRFNLLALNGATVVLDYGHNVSALRALTEALGHLPQRRRTVIYSSSGDRRECELVRQGELLGEAFDRVVLYEDPRYLRGIEEGWMTGLFRRGLQAGRRVREVLEVRGWLQAVEAELAALRPGDLLVIQPDLIDETVDLIRHYLAGGDRGREIDLAEAAALAGPGPEASPGVEVRQGRLGKGIFARRSFAEGEPILRGWGEPAARRVRESIQVGADLHIVPRPPLVYLNHCCEPNCGVLISRCEEQIEVRALRPIEPGEELTVDYATFESEIAGHDGRCQCGAPSCRGRITGYKDLPASLRAAYGPYIAEHLREDEGVSVADGAAELAGQAAGS
jgi:cyanophycin synthetase